MRVFVAGAAGAIGQPLIAELVRQGHTVTGMTHSEAGARKFVEMGAVSDSLVSCPQGKKLGRDFCRRPRLTSFYVIYQLVFDHFPDLFPLCPAPFSFWRRS